MLETAEARVCIGCKCASACSSQLHVFVRALTRHVRPRLRRSLSSYHVHHQQHHHHHRRRHDPQLRDSAVSCAMATSCTCKTAEGAPPAAVDMASRSMVPRWHHTHAVSAGDSAIGLAAPRRSTLYLCLSSFEAAATAGQVARVAVWLRLLWLHRLRLRAPVAACLPLRPACCC